MASTGLTGLSSAVAWRVFMKDPEKQLDKFAKNKDVQKDLDYFKKAVTKYTSVDDLLKDRKAMNVLLSAFDLQDEAVTGMGRIKKVLTENPTADTALSKKLADTRFAAMANELRLDQGLTTLQRKVRLGTIDDKYVQSEFEQALGDQDPALREAAYFARNAASKTGSVYAVLGDKIMRDVVQSTLDIPKQIAIQLIETQARVLTQRIDVTKFSAALKAAGGLTGTQISTAKADNTLLTNNLKVSDAAIKQVQSLQTVINKAISDYGSIVTKPASSPEVQVQAQASQDTLRFEQMLIAGGNATDRVAQSVTSLKDLIGTMKRTTNSAQLSALMERFESAMTSLDSQFTLSRVKVPEVTTSSGESRYGMDDILAYRSGETLTTQLNASGTQNAAIRTYDKRPLRNLASQAEEAYFDFRANANPESLDNALIYLNTLASRVDTIKTTIGTDLKQLQGQFPLVPRGMSFSTGSVMRASRSIDDAVSRSQDIDGLLKQISTLADTSAKRAPGASRADLNTQFEKLRTQIADKIGRSGAMNTDNLLDQSANKNYILYDGVTDFNGDNITVSQTVTNKSSLLQDVLTALNAADLNSVGNAQALSTKALQLTNKTDAAVKSLKADGSVFSRVIQSLDPKAKIDKTLYDLGASLDKTVTGAAVGTVNLLASDQKDIPVTLSSSGTSLKLRATPTFKSDVLAQLQSVYTAFDSGIGATRSAVSTLSGLVDRTVRTLQADNRTLTFEQGKIGAVLDTLDTEKAADGTERYKVNSFTEKFLNRYLITNGADGAVSSSNPLLGLFNGTASAGNILSLSLSV